MSRRSSQDPTASKESFGTLPPFEDIPQQNLQATPASGSYGRYNFPPVSVEASRRNPANPTQVYQDSYPGPTPVTSRMPAAAAYQQAPPFASGFQGPDDSSLETEPSAQYLAGSPSRTPQRSTRPGWQQPHNPTQLGPPSNRGKPWPTRKRTNHDEFDGDFQLLPESAGGTLIATEENLPSLPTNLRPGEQEAILNKLERVLCECAFKVMAKYQFPVPVEEGKKLVEHPSDRTWNEWAYILKRLATKRRIPARILYEERIKQMITVLENSVDVRPAASHRSRALKDDRYILQMISAGIQVAKLFMDGETMNQLSELYEETEAAIRIRTGHEFGAA